MTWRECNRVRETEAAKWGLLFFMGWSEKAFLVPFNRVQKFSMGRPSLCGLFYMILKSSFTVP